MEVKPKSKRKFSIHEMANCILNTIKQCIRRFVLMCEIAVDFVRRFLKNIFISNNLSCIDRIIRAMVFLEVESELTRHLHCEFKLKRINELNCSCLILQPREMNDETKHIVVFKSHGTSIFSFAQGFLLDLLANSYNIAWYVIDYKKERYDRNVKVGNRRSKHCLDHFVACVDVLIAKINAKGHKPYLFGFSLGCAMLLEYASRTEQRLFHKIILLSPFLSLREYLSRNYILLWFIGKRIDKNFSFNNRINITKIAENSSEYTRKNKFTDRQDDILIVHGKLDKVIPKEQAEELARIGGCEFVNIPWCKHVDIVTDRCAWRKIMEFLNKN